MLGARKERREELVRGRVRGDCRVVVEYNEDGAGGAKR